MDTNINTPTSEINKDELVALCSVRTDGSLRQQRVLEHLTSREDETFQEVEVGVDHSVEPTLSKDCRRMFEAVTRGDFKILSILLTKNKTKFGAIDKEGNTALHCAVMSACHKRYTHDNYYSCINMLMNCQKMKINMPNKHGYTALGYALNELHEKCVEYMLKHPSSNRLYLDYYPGDREYTVRDIIEEKFPELKEFLPVPLMESLDSPDRDKKRLAALQHDEYGIFKENHDSTNPNPWYDEPYHSSLLEIACQMKARNLFVYYLLDHDANPNIRNHITGMPLLHAIARSGNFELLEVLVKEHKINASVKDSEERTILHCLAGLRERERGDKYKIEHCLELLLTSKCEYIREMGVDDRDSSWNTALSIAVESGFKDRAKLLLMNGADVTIFEEGSKILLSASLPILEKILDDCLLSNDKPVTSKNYRLEFEKREFLWNLSLRMAESKHLSDLLRHPVISTFLSLKWKSVKLVFSINMLFYVMFVLSLSAYILYSDSYNTPNDGGVANNTTGPFSFNDSYITSGINENNFTSQPYDTDLHFLWHMVMGLLSLFTLKEVYQLFTHRWAYVVSLENWLEILLIIVTFVSCSGVVSSMVMKLHFSAVALLLGWLELLLVLGRLPQLSVQQKMLKTVSFTFLRFMAGYVLLLIAFALSFYILFKGSLEMDGIDLFASPHLSVLKTTVMFTGEFDVSNLPFDNFPGTSHVIFLLFVFLVAIILFNVLSVAVSEAGEIRNTAETLSLVARVKLISRIEEFVSALPKFITYGVIRTHEMSVIYPNKRNRIGSTALRSLSIIDKKRQRNKERESSGSQEKWDMFTEKLSALQLRQDKLEKKLDSKSDETQQIIMEILNRLDSRKCETTHL